jgi:hypothetical protein
MGPRRTLLCLGLALLAAGPLPAGDGFRYVVPAPGEPFANPPPRALGLLDRRPPDLKEGVRYRGGRQRYGRLCYGSGRAANVDVVVDEIAPGQVDLYLDADRDQNITAKDRVAGNDLTWRVPLDALVPEGDATRRLPRTVVFRYGRVGRTLSVATCGYLEGRVALDGKPVAVRRVDGDANGLFADPQDRLWIDLNGDGAWDAATEQFLFAPILRLGEKRFAVRGDARGERLSFAPLEGTGTLRLTLPRNLKPEAVEDVQVTVQSRDGIVATLNGLDAAVTVPTGDYRVSSLLLTLRDAGGGPAWGYVFTDNGGKGDRWHVLKKDGTLALDPVGGLEFVCGVQKEKDECRAGDALFVRPALYTGDGLLIERAYRGPFQSSPFDSGAGGRIVLRGADGAVLDSGTCGFA